MEPPCFSAFSPSVEGLPVSLTSLPPRACAGQLEELLLYLGLLNLEGQVAILNAKGGIDLETLQEGGFDLCQRLSG